MAGVGASASVCPVSPTTLRRAPGVRLRTPWYGRAKGSLLVAATPWHAGETKVGWLRPRHTTIRMTGRLRQGAGPRIMQTISPRGYDGISQPSVLVFPVTGCWEISAVAGRARSRFTVRVFPASYRLAQGCYTLRDAAKQSAAVVVARINARVGDGAYAWVGASVERVVAGRIRPSTLTGGFSSWSWRGGREIEVLQRPSDPPLRLGGRYLVFLATLPGTPAGIACGGVAGIARVNAQKVIALVQRPLWHGDSLEAVAREIRAAFAAR
jgi:hypothetical protein